MRNNTSVSEGFFCVKVAHHISSFWIPVYTDSEIETGSIGAGFLIDPYYKVCIEPSSTLKKRKFLGRTLKELYAILIPPNHINIKERERLPISYGYATSAARAIGHSIAISLAKKEGFTIGDALRAAHIAEVRARTGLGDVSAIAYGRYIPVRLKPGAPGFSYVDSIYVRKGKYKLLTAQLKRMSTDSLLKDRQDLFEEAGSVAMSMVLESPNIETLVQASMLFSQKTKMMDEIFYRKINSVLSAVDNLGFFVKKGLLVVVIENDEEERARRILESELGLKLRVHNLVERGLIIEEQ